MQIKFVTKKIKLQKQTWTVPVVSQAILPAANISLI